MLCERVVQANMRELSLPNLDIRYHMELAVGVATTAVATAVVSSRPCGIMKERSLCMVVVPHHVMKWIIA